MRKWWTHVTSGPIPLSLAVTFLVTMIAIRLAPAQAPGDAAGPMFYATADATAPEAGANITAREVGAYGSASVHHLRLAEGVKRHYHRDHDETVVVLSGRGRMTLGDETREIGPGTILLLPRGTRHELVVTDGPLEAVSLFSPRFDGQDRIFVEE